ncbi:MAG: hypothetical protein H6993_16280 [Pseudomonadales bacterium]|nr:hypothetical protein [Pseudomonadales bacterium]
MALACWNCGEDLTSVPKPISRHAQCPSCFEALRCCRLCQHFDEATAGQCREERADPPTRKESANFCEFFRPRANAYVDRRGKAASDAKAKLEALFGSQETDQAIDNALDRSPSPPSRDDAARAALEALFRKPD